MLLQLAHDQAEMLNSSKEMHIGWGRAARRMRMEFDEFRRLVIQVQKRQIEPDAVGESALRHPAK